MEILAWRRHLTTGNLKTTGSQVPVSLPVDADTKSPIISTKMVRYHFGSLLKLLIRFSERLTLGVHILCAGNYYDAEFDVETLEDSNLKIASDYPKDFHDDADILTKSLY